MLKLQFSTFLLAIFLSACGGGGGSSSPAPAPVVCGKPNPSLSATPELIAYGDSTMLASTSMIQEALNDQGVVVEFDNRAIGGTMLHLLVNGSCEYPTPLAADLADEKKARVVLENFGINEVYFHASAISSFTAQVRMFVTTVRNAGMVPVLITPVKSLNSAEVPPATLAAFAQAKRDVAAEMNVRLVDVYELPVTSVDFYPDMIHPVPAFSQRIAEFTAEQIKDLL